MCGILGWVSFDGAPPPHRDLEKSLDVLHHRGPDNAGRWQGRGAWMGHRRLSIIDLTELGNQPMVSPDGRYIITYNGEFYNYQEHIAFLKEKGYPLHSHSDTEVLLGLYSLLGEQCLDRVNGMFALAIWDTQTHSLFLARDRFGKKPLYYCMLDSSRVVFASEMKALVPLLDSRTLHGQAVDAFFSFGYVPSPLSIYQEVKKLEPATCVSVTPKGVHKRKYWMLDPSAAAEEGCPSDDEIEAALVKSIDLRFTSDVPVGVFLSGGIDSSLITALAVGKLEKRFGTLCVGGGQGCFDERKHAAAVAAQYGTDHTDALIETGGVVELIHRVMPFIDEPFSDSSILPTYLVCNLAAGKGKVVLSGEGGDEVFGGYDKYRRWLQVKTFQKIPLFLRRRLAAAQPGVNGYHRSLWRSLVNLNRHSLSEDVCIFSALNSLMTLYFKQQLFTEPFGHDYCSDNADLFRSLDSRTFKSDSLEKFMDIDRRTYLSEDLMFKVDRMAMANSLEVRCPFLDYELVELSLRIPEREKLNLKNNKIVLRRLAQRCLPETITDRPKKGFSVPVSNWLKGQLIPVFNDYVARDDVLSEVFDYEEIQRRFSMHREGQYEFGNQLWAILVFHIWWQVHGKGTRLS